MADRGRTDRWGSWAAAAFWVTLVACIAGLLTYWATGFLDPERGSGVGEALFLSLSPALVIALLVWVVLRAAPAASGIIRLVVLALGWGLFVVTSLT